MNPERDERLIQGYLDRVLTPADIEELNALLVADPEFRRAFVEAARHESFLENSLKELSNPKQGPPAQESQDPAAKPSTRRRLDRRFTRSTPASWTPFLIAAAALFAVVLLATLSGSDPKPNRSEAARRSPEKERRVEPPPPRELVEAAPPPKEPEPKPATPAPEPSAEEKRQAELARARQVEEEMRRRLEEERRKQSATPAPEPVKPPQPPPKPEPEKRETTQTGIAKVECKDGEVSLLTPSGKRLFQGTESVLPGYGLEVAAQGRADVIFPDGTRLEVGPGTCVEEIRADAGKRVVIARGTVKADVAKQPKEEPMLFPTPHGEAKVLGTTLRLAIDPDPRKGTRLEVTEGKVQLTRKLDGKTVDVLSGQFAVAAAGVALETRPMPIDEIVLFARDGRIRGGDWRVEKDPQALTGFTLHAPKAWSSDLSILAMKQGSLGYVEFEFDADADQVYTVWVRAKTPPNADIGHDGVGLQLPKDLFVKPCGYFKNHGIFDAHLFTAYFYKDNYWWGADEETPSAGNKPNLIAAVQIRFTNPGRQILRLYPAEGPIRVDAIWLSKTVTQRPAESNHPIPAAASLRAKAK